MIAQFESFSTRMFAFLTSICLAFGLFVGMAKAVMLVVENQNAASIHIKGAARHGQVVVFLNPSSVNSNNFRPAGKRQMSEAAAKAREGVKGKNIDKGTANAIAATEQNHDSTPVVIDLRQAPATEGPKLVQGVTDFYPDLEFEQGVEGEAVLQFSIQKNGHVADIVVLEGDANVGFVDAATYMASSWVFEEMSNPITMVMPFQFRLD